MATSRGTNGNDNLSGAHGFQFVYGLGGNDTITSDFNFIPSELYGGDGNDTLNLFYPGTADGGTGNDIINGSLGNDDLYGGSGDDRINSGDPSGGLDFVDGGDGNDIIVAGGVVLGGAGNDNISASSADVDIFGGDGADLINAGSGSDELIGGDGNDLLLADGADGDDRMFGGEGIDTVSYAGLGAVGLELAGDLGTLGTGAAAGDRLRGIEVLILSNFNDVIIGDGADTTFDGRGGLDVINGGDGIDTASYADKTAFVRVTLTGATQASVLVNDVQEDLIRNIENLIGGTGDDRLGGDGFANDFRGGGGSDSLRTREGNDILDGGAGGDTMNGGPDSDTYFVDTAADAILDSAGTDNVNTSVSYALAAGVAIETLRTTNAAGTTAINLTGSEFANTIIGNAGNNILNGRGGVDTLQGLAGNDAYYVDNVGDKVVDTAGVDNVNAFVSYALSAGVAIETLRTTSAAGTAIINLTGNEFANAITGNAGANIINGGAGNDTLNSGLGNDILIGNLGRDVSTGGAGNDTFRYLAITHSPVGAGADVLQDFDDIGNDVIDLSALFGPAMTYRHNLGFTAAGQVRFNDVVGADVVVEVNTGGSLVADVQIRLVNTTLASMAGSDFLLL